VTWTPPSIAIKWGPYTKPDPSEQQAVVGLVVAARGGKTPNGDASGEPLITKRAAVEKLKEAGVFTIDNVAAFLESLEEETEEREAKQVAKERSQLDAAKSALAEANAVGGAVRPSADAKGKGDGPDSDRGRSVRGEVNAS